MTCRSCEKKGHVECACRAKKSTNQGTKTDNKKDNVKFRKKRQVHTVKGQMEDSNSSEEGLSASVNTVRVLSVDEESDGFWINAKLKGNSIKMQIDTGSRASIVPYKTYKKCLKHLQFRPLDTVFKAYTRHHVHMKGMTDVRVRYNGQSGTLPVYVTKVNFTTIMGHAWLTEFWLDWQEVRKQSTYSMQLQSILGKHDQIFCD